MPDLLYPVHDQRWIQISPYLGPRSFRNTTGRWTMLWPLHSLCGKLQVFMWDKGEGKEAASQQQWHTYLTHRRFT